MDTGDLADGGRSGFLLSALLDGTATAKEVSLALGRKPTWRFFPTSDAVPHPADEIVDAALALAWGRDFRDYVRLLELGRKGLSIAAAVWAACGKDHQLTPAFALNMMSFHTRYTAADVAALPKARHIGLVELKLRWLAAKDAAEALFARLPKHELGCLYLDADNNPVTPDPGSPTFPSLTRHFGSVRGAWPSVS